jgi:hypothetical protein
VAEGAVIIIAISVGPPPIIVASARTSRKGISETPPDPKFDRSDGYRRECYGTVGTPPPERGVGQAKA